MENKRGFIMRNGTCIGMDVQRVYTSTPVGVIQAFSGTTIPRGFLLCDGQSYAVAEYPDLYAVIGNTYGGDTENFNVPDYRETVLVGVGENTTDTIASHDVYELGEFKDDQMQDHKHSTTIGIANGENILTDSFASTNEKRYDAYTKGMNTGRIGTTTHGKQKGVTYIIKAFHTNEGADSGVSNDVIDYVDNKVDGLIDDNTSSTTSTYSSAKIDKKFALRHFGTDNKTLWLKLQLGTITTHEPITVTDQYGGQIKILGMYDLSTYKSVKVIRISYGDWTTHSGTDVSTTTSGDGNYKIRRLFYCPDDNNYYLEIRQYSYISVEGAPDATMVTSLPVETSAMTLIPESGFARKKDIDGTSFIIPYVNGGFKYYSLVFGDAYQTTANQDILIQHNRLNFCPITYIFNATSYRADRCSVTQVAGIMDREDFYTYSMSFYLDETAKTLYLKVPSYSRVTLTDLLIRTTAITVTEVDAIPDTATKMTITEYASISDTSINTTSTWSSSKIASEISSKATKQNAVRNTDYLKSDRPYLKISRNGSLSHVGYYICETYILCNHLGNMGALSFIRTDSGASCVYKDIVGTLSLAVEKSDEYTCWLKYSGSSSEIITVYALNGYTPTVSAVTSTT